MRKEEGRPIRIEPQQVTQYSKLRWRKSVYREYPMSELIADGTIKSIPKESKDDVFVEEAENK